MKDKFFIFSNPLFWIWGLYLLIAVGIKWFWSNIIWHRRWWYWHKWDYYWSKKVFTKGVNQKQINGLKFWLKHEKKRTKYQHKYLREMELLLKEAENNLEKEAIQKGVNHIINKIDSAALETKVE